MKKLRASAGWIIVTVILIVFFVVIYGGVPKFLIPTATTSASPLTSETTLREIVQMQIAPDAKKREEMTIAANKLPEFNIDLAAPKYQEIIKSSGDALKEKVQAKITYSGKANIDGVEPELKINAEKSKLVIHPNDLPTFKPGKYLLHITLRTIEGNVSIDQDFTWGVIAVNTDKSIYKPGEIATIGFGVLDDGGNTQCVDSADIVATITAPNGQKTQISTTDGTIKDSGECGPITFTNKADFVASYKTSTNGIYQLKVIASIKDGPKREIEDYFKVDSEAKFDVTRYDFPTRIYPKIPYPVAFSVTAKEAYSGTIEEFVPSDFEIVSINNGGRVEDAGEFKKIVWDVQLQPNEETYYSYLIKFPMVSPEFYLLGPITIGQFKEARQWQIASDAINSTSGVLTYEDNGTSNTWARIWSGTAFQGQTQLDASPVDSRWFVEKSSPKTGEKLVAAMDNNNDGNRILYMFRWDGSGWTQDFTVDPGTNWPDAFTRYFDIAYEEESGDALFVYGDSTGNSVSYYRKTSSSVSWTGPAVAGTALDSRKRWVKAKSQFNSDTILVGYLNDNELIGALIWDGSSNTFGNQFEDDNTPAQTGTVTSENEAFDIAWETQSATPMIFWGTAAQQLMYREFSGGVWSGETAIYTTTSDGDVDDDIHWVTASADPRSTSNYIALAMQETGDTDSADDVSDCEFGMWNGSGVASLGSAIVCRSDFDGRLNNVQFENTGGRAVFVYVPSETTTSGNTLYYRTWTAGDASPGSSTAITGDATGDIESVQLHSDLNSKSMIALIAGSDGDLNHYEWEGDASTWTAYVSTDLFANIQTGGENAEAYGFGFDRNIETLVAYRWFENLNIANGGSTLNPLTTNSTPYTLTTEGQAFRLRLLLYYPDALLSSAFRQYKLQYVDPGTGTCENPTGGTPSTYTDVPTSGGTTISFNNNSLLNSGDNIATNSADPTYLSYSTANNNYQYQDYQESNNFTNSRTNMRGDQVAIWDFSLIDNTDLDTVQQTYCFRVVRSNNIVLHIEQYPQISTASVSDVLIQSGSLIQSGTLLQ